MKKKIAALLTAALVMTMSTATVFAAPSVSVDENVKNNISSSTTEGVSAGTFTESVVTLNDVKEQAVANMGSNEKDLELLAVTELTGTVPTDGKVTLLVTGIKAGETLFALHYTSTGWERLNAQAVADGVVEIYGFSSFSPVAIVRYTPVPTEEEEGQAEELQTSPKTGVVIPVAAMTAGICLAGAAVCGKKVKFN